MASHLSSQVETNIYTNSSGFNSSNGDSTSPFKRYGLNSHGGVEPHVHHPKRNVSPKTGIVYGTPGRKTSNGEASLPTNKDIKNLYDHLYNGKYEP